jgi:hypothetical protein
MALADREAAARDAAAKDAAADAAAAREIKGMAAAVAAVMAHGACAIQDFQQSVAAADSALDCAEALFDSARAVASCRRGAAAPERASWAAVGGGVGGAADGAEGLGAGAAVGLAGLLGAHGGATSACDDTADPSGPLEGLPVREVRPCRFRMVAPSKQGHHLLMYVLLPQGLIPLCMPLDSAVGGPHL